MALSRIADHKIIPPGSSDPRIDVVVGAILHVDAANSPSLYNYFNGPSGGIESHFFIKLDGTIEQYRDTNYEADANYHANSWVSGGKRYGFVSIETQGYGNGIWNDAQLVAIKRLLTELAGEHGFPLRRCPGPFSPGVGYHTMWGAPSDWTPVSKTCPGPNRVIQYDQVLVPWFATAAHSFDKMDPASYYLGVEGPHVRWLGERLVAHGFDKHGDDNGYQPGPVFTRYDRANVRAAQIAAGVPREEATGFPGKTLLVSLARAPKPTIAPGPSQTAAGQLRAARANLNAAAQSSADPRAAGALTLVRKALRTLRGK
ncbi:MAG TPA: N-acetylmuramoyl-L-alanine amidase [Phytomonospora sp.]